MLNYREACEQAKILSQDGCVRHVNAVLQLPSEFSEVDDPWIEGYEVSDWTDGSTVKSFCNGKEV
jgi:hypothetical protein